MSVEFVIENRHNRGVPSDLILTFIFPLFIFKGDQVPDVGELMLASFPESGKFRKTISAENSWYPPFPFPSFLSSSSPPFFTIYFAANDSFQLFVWFIFGFSGLWSFWFFDFLFLVAFSQVSFKIRYILSPVVFLHLCRTFISYLLCPYEKLRDIRLPFLLRGL